MNKYGYESIEHKSLKFKVFNEIVCGNEIYDKNNKKININLNIPDSFLHIESPVIKTRFCNGFKNTPLYSNNGNHCLSRINNPICGFNTFSEFIGEVPCVTCIMLNNIALNSFCGYRPDIAYGVKDEFRVWIEIEVTSKISYHKYEFCRNNNIKLYYIENEHDINNTGELIINEVDELYFYEDMDKLSLEIKEQINKCGYCIAKDVKEKMNIIGLNKDVFKKYLSDKYEI
jgi:hypothetical protein